METIINVLLTSSVGMIGVIVGHFVAKHNHVFQKVYDRKSNLIIDLYKQVVRLEFAIKKYVYFTGAETGENSNNKKIEELNIIKGDFQCFQHKFWEVEIILEDSTVEKINKFLETYIAITAKLSVSQMNQQLRDFNRSFDKWNESFDSVSGDLAKIKEELKKEFRDVLRK